MTTLFDISLAVARSIGGLRVEQASTNGTSTTLVDADLGGHSGDWEDGTLWNITKEEFSKISSYDSKTGTLTLVSTLTSSEADDRYALLDREFTLDEIISAINSTLSMMKYPKTDTTTVTIADDQSEYDLPTDCHDLRQVYRPLNDDTNENLWLELYGWKLEKTASGTADKLIIDHHGIDTGDTLKLVYCLYHDPVYASDSEVDDWLPEAVIIAESVVYLLMNSAENINTSEKNLGSRLEFWDKRRERAHERFPIRLPQRRGTVLITDTRDEVDVELTTE